MDKIKLVQKLVDATSPKITGGTAAGWTERMYEIADQMGDFPLSKVAWNKSPLSVATRIVEISTGLIDGHARLKGTIQEFQSK